MKTTRIQDYQVATVDYEVTTTVTEKAVTITNQLPPLPLDLWCQIVTFLCDVSATNKSEGMLSLTVVNGEWVPIVWHQSTPSALTIKYNESDEENQALLTDEVRDALKQIHCTVHSHHTAGASQSGEDVQDEKAKRGWHITIGHCDKPKVSTHMRFNCCKDAEFGTEGEQRGEKVSEAEQQFIAADIEIVIEDPPAPPEGINPSWMMNKKDIITSNHQVDYPEEWLGRVTTPTLTATHTPTYSRTNTGWGLSTERYYQMGSTGWDEESRYGNEKKTNFGTMNMKAAKAIWTGNLFDELYGYANPFFVFCQFLFQKYFRRENIAEDFMQSLEGDNTLSENLKECKKSTLEYISQAAGIKHKEVSKHLPKLDDVLDSLHEAIETKGIANYLVMDNTDCEEINKDIITDIYYDYEVPAEELELQ